MHWKQTTPCFIVPQSIRMIAGLGSHHSGLKHPYFTHKQAAKGCEKATKKSLQAPKVGELKEEQLHSEIPEPLKSAKDFWHLKVKSFLGCACVRNKFWGVGVHPLSGASVLSAFHSPPALRLTSLRNFYPSHLFGNNFSPQLRRKKIPETTTCKDFPLQTSAQAPLPGAHPHNSPSEFVRTRRGGRSSSGRVWRSGCTTRSLT